MSILYADKNLNRIVPVLHDYPRVLLRKIWYLLCKLVVPQSARVNSSGKHPRYEVECTGKLVSMDVCYKKAASLCPNGYKILDKNVMKHNPYLLPTPLGISTELANSMPGVVKGINIECK